MNELTELLPYIIAVLLGGGLLLLLYKALDALDHSVPDETVRDIIREAINGVADTTNAVLDKAIDAMREHAEATETEYDDLVVDIVERVLRSLRGQGEDAPPDDPDALG